MAYYTLSRLGDSLPDGASDLVDSANRLIVDLADKLIEDVSVTGYGTVMDRDAGNYSWGGSGHAGNQGIALINAYRLTGDRTYLDFALSNLDYLLGRNATGYSFLTGFGSKPPLNLHHRPSEARKLREPVPGLLSGGPNPGQQDECIYPSDLPAQSYIDDWCSYAANEITINWNAPLVYLAAAMEALQYQAGYSDKERIGLNR